MLLRTFQNADFKLAHSVQSYEPGLQSHFSSPESDSSDESKFRSLPVESKSRRSKGTADESTSRGARSVTDESKLCHHQPTMWLGTEDGCIYVYNCTDYVRVKKTTVKVHLGAAVQSMVYMDGRVFVGLSSGAFAVFSRAAGTSIDPPIDISVIASSAVARQPTLERCHD